MTNTARDGRVRVIKVEGISQYFKNGSKPRIRLKGNWLKEAGFLPNSYCVVENDLPGWLTIRVFEPVISE